MKPSRFGSYELLEQIASGGMAEVFRAKAIRAGGVTKAVCLKRIHPRLSADPTFVGMFIEEARLGLTLSHGNIVPVFDFGCIDGHHYIAMDFIEGRDLSSIIARGRIVSKPFPPELAAYVTMELLEGLAYAHGQEDDEGQPLELVHRDISPSNVIVSRAGEVKILDFGIARSALRELQTRTGVIKGKPGYMAPEQAKGLEVDVRADIFACGVLLHELVTGRRPHAEARSEDNSLQNEIEEPLLSVVVARAVEADPEGRYPSAPTMLEALGDYLEDMGARPAAAGLASHVETLFGARAVAPDWSHKGAAVDRLLGEQVPSVGEETGPDTVPLGGPGGGVDNGRLASLESEGSGAAGPPRAVEPELAAEAGEPSSSPPRDHRFRRWGVVALGFVVVSVALALSAPMLVGPDRPAPDVLPPAPPAEPDPARLEVRTSPPGAAVSIDGDRGEELTPTTISVAPGVRSVEVSLRGYRAVGRELEARAGQLVVMDVALAPAVGILAVVSEPPGGRVRIDGRDVGLSPVKIDAPLTEELAVEVNLHGHRPWSKAVSLEGRESLSVVAHLEARPRPTVAGGFLSVNVHPWAEVVVDGTSLGHTPIVRRPLSAGRHVVVLRNAARGREVTRSVMIRPGQEARVTVDLSDGK